MANTGFTVMFFYFVLLYYIRHHNIILQIKDPSKISGLQVTTSQYLLKLGLPKPKIGTT